MSTLRGRAGRRHFAVGGLVSALLCRSPPGVHSFLLRSSTLPGMPVSGTCPAAAAMSTDAVITKEKKKLQPKYRASYRPPPYFIRDVDLDINLSKPDPDGSSVTYVTSTLHVHKGDTAAGANLELDGEVRQGVVLNLMYDN